MDLTHSSGSANDEDSSSDTRHARCARRTCVSQSLALTSSTRDSQRSGSGHHVADRGFSGASLGEFTMEGQLPGSRLLAARFPGWFVRIFSRSAPLGQRRAHGSVFFLVGLEIKRECVHGELAEWRVAIFPVAAAAGGMIVPALIYWGLNHGQETAVGWGIPIPTDIAFALGVLALLGSRIPVQLRLFLLTLAIADDIGAILVIATFYVQHISWLALSGAIAILGFIVGMRWIGLRTVGLFVVVGAIFWLAVQRSGIHPTIAGVILGLLTPSSAWFSHSTFSDRMTPLLQRFTRIGGKADAESSAAMLGRIETLAQETEPLVERLQRVVYPWVTFGVLPLFALVNCGVSFSMQGLQDSLFSPVTQGILFGLVLGKPLGVLGGSWLIVRSRIARLPAPLTWHHLWGVGALAGIGFTVSLFVTGLAFDSGNQAEQAKIGILSASVLAGSLGYCMLIVMNRLKAQ